MAEDWRDIDRIGRSHMHLELDARQRQEIVDQPAHARRLVVHNRQKPLPRLGIVPRRALQGLDETCE